MTEEEYAGLTSEDKANLLKQWDEAHGEAQGTAQGATGAESVGPTAQAAAAMPSAQPEQAAPTSAPELNTPPAQNYDPIAEALKLRKENLARMNARTKQAEEAQRKLQYVVDANGDDKEYAADTEQARQGLSFFQSHMRAFDNADDDKVNAAMTAVDDLYNATKNRRGFLKRAWDSVVRGYWDTGSMTAQGVAAMNPLMSNEEVAELGRNMKAVREANETANPRGNVNSLRDVKGVGDFAEYAIGAAAENLPRMVGGIAGSTAGAVAGFGVAGPAGVVPGAMLGGAAATMAQNTGEAVGDQIDEEVKFSRGLAMGQGFGYAVLDGVLGSIPGVGAAWAKMLKAAGKEPVKQGVKALMEMGAKSTFKGAAKTIGKETLKEGVTESAQSGIVGRARRYAQTGTPFTKEEIASGDPAKEALWAAADEFVGGAAAALLTGGGAHGIDYANNRAIRQRVANVVNPVVNTEEFRALPAEYQLLVGKHILNDAMAATEEVTESVLGDKAKRKDFDKGALAAENAEIDAALEKDKSKGAEAARAVLNAMTAGESLADFNEVVEKAKAQGITPTTDALELYDSARRFNKPDGTWGGVEYKGKDGVYVVETADEDDNARFVVGNSGNGFKNPIGATLAFDNLRDAITAAEDLSVYNQALAEAYKPKAAAVNAAFEKMYGGSGVKLELVQGDRRVGLSPSAYREGDNTLTVYLDNVKNVGQLYTALAHEKVHKQIAAFVAEKAKSRDELFGNGKVADAEELANRRRFQGANGETDTAEELLAENASVREVVGALRRMDDGAAPAAWKALKRALGAKMAEDMGISPDLVTDAAVREELKFLEDKGFLGEQKDAEGTEAVDFGGEDTLGKAQTERERAAAAYRAEREAAQAKGREAWQRAAQIVADGKRLRAEMEEARRRAAEETEMENRRKATEEYHERGRQIQYDADLLANTVPEEYAAWLEHTNMKDDAARRVLFYKWFLDNWEAPQETAATAAAEPAATVAQSGSPAAALPNQTAEPTAPIEPPVTETAQKVDATAPATTAQPAEKTTVETAANPEQPAQPAAQPATTAQNAQKPPVETAEENGETITPPADGAKEGAKTAVSATVYESNDSKPRPMTEEERKEAAYLAWLATQKTEKGKPKKDSGAMRAQFEHLVKQGKVIVKNGGGFIESRPVEVEEIVPKTAPDVPKTAPVVPKTEEPVKTDDAKKPPLVPEKPVEKPVPAKDVQKDGTPSTSSVVEALTEIEKIELEIDSLEVKINRMRAESFPSSAKQKKRDKHQKEIANLEKEKTELEKRAKKIRSEIDGLRAPAVPFAEYFGKPNAKKAEKAVDLFVTNPKDVLKWVSKPYHDKKNKVVVAVNGKILIATKYGFDPNAKNEYEDAFPKNWQSVIPKNPNVSIKVNPAEIVNTCKKAIRLSKTLVGKKSNSNKFPAVVMFRVGDRRLFFNAYMLKNVALAMVANGMDELKFEATKDGQIDAGMAQNDNTTIVIMLLHNAAKYPAGRSEIEYNDESLVFDGQTGRIASAPYRNRDFHFPHAMLEISKREYDEVKSTDTSKEIKDKLLATIDKIEKRIAAENEVEELLLRERDARELLGAYAQKGRTEETPPASQPATTAQNAPTETAQNAPTDEERAWLGKTEIGRAILGNYDVAVKDDADFAAKQLRISIERNREELGEMGETTVDAQGVAQETAETAQTQEVESDIYDEFVSKPGRYHAIPNEYGLNWVCVVNKNITEWSKQEADALARRLEDFGYKIERGRFDSSVIVTGHVNYRFNDQESALKEVNSLLENGLSKDKAKAKKRQQPAAPTEVLQELRERAVAAQRVLKAYASKDDKTLKSYVRQWRGRGERGKELADAAETLMEYRKAAQEAAAARGEGEMAQDEQGGGARFKTQTRTVTPEEDAAYMDAVTRGDMEKCAEMVRMAAARAWPDTKVVDEDGLPLMLWHGGGTWEPNKVESGTFYFYDDKRAARGYGKVMSAFVNIIKPVDIDAEGRMNYDVYGEIDYLSDDDSSLAGTSIDDVVSKAQYPGDEDGVIVRNVIDTGAGDDIMGTVVVAFNYDRSSIKSADPVTYDDAGNVIPLSKRFDAGNNDIRYKTASHPIPPNTPVNKQYMDDTGSRAGRIKSAYMANFADRFRPVYETMRDALMGDGKTKVAAEKEATNGKDSPYFAKRTEGSRAERNAQRARGIFNDLTKAIREPLAKLGLDSWDVGAWAYASHAEERNAQKLKDHGVTDGSGISDAKAQDILNGRGFDLNGKRKQYSLAQRQALENARKDFVQRINKDFGLDFLHEAGLIDAESVKRLKNAYGFDWVSLMDDLGEDGVDYGANTSVANPLRRAKGRKNELEANPLASTMAGALSNIVNAEKNRSAETLAKFIEGDKGQGVPAHPEMGTVRELADGEKIDDSMIIFRRNVLVPDDKEQNVKMAIVLNGERGADMARAFTDKDVQRGPKAVQWLTRHWAAFATQLSPTFSARNLLKDTVEVTLNTIATQGPAAAARFLKGQAAMFPLWNKDFRRTLKEWRETGNVTGTSDLAKSFREFVGSGALIGGAVREGYTDLNDQLKEAERELSTAKGTAKKAAAAWNWYVEKVSAANEAIELLSRFNNFRNRRNAGESVEEAAINSREDSTDFNMYGKQRWMNNVWMFSNSILGGAMRAGKTLAFGKYGRYLAAGLIAMGILEEAANWLANGDDDEENEKTGDPTEKDVSEYDRENSFRFRVGGKMVKVPIHFGPFSALKYAGGNAFRAATGQISWEKATANVANAVAKTASHFSGTGEHGFAKDDPSFLPAIMPTAVVQPMVQIAVNEDYKGAKIHKDHNLGPAKYAPGWQYAKPNTSEVWVGISRALNRLSGGSDYTRGRLSWAPEDIEYFAKQIFKNFGTDVMNATVEPVAATYKTAMTGDNHFALKNVPFVRDVVKTSADVAQRYYAMAEEHAEEHQAFRKMRGEERRAYLRKHPTAGYNTAKIEDAIKRYTALARGDLLNKNGQVVGHREITSAQKDAFDKKRRQLMANFLKIVRK